MRRTVEPILGISLPSPDTRPTAEGKAERQRTALVVDVVLLVGLEVRDGGVPRRCVDDIRLQR